MDSDKTAPKSFAFRWRDAVLSGSGPACPTTRLVLACMTKYMDGDGRKCFPSISTLGADTGLGERSVKRHVAQAKAQGWITVQSRGANGQGWRRNVYIPCLPKGEASVTPRLDEGGASVAPRQAKGGATGGRKVGPLSPKGGATGAHYQTSYQTNDQSSSGEEESPAKPDDAPGPNEKARKSKTPPCPAEQIVDEYHRLLPELPAVAKLTSSRRKALQARWRERKGHQSIDFWREYFADAVRAQPFLMGDNPRGWRADFEWLVRESNFYKTVEGRYENAGT